MKPFEIDKILEKKKINRKKIGKLVAGIGINDSDFQVGMSIGGKIYCHTLYKTWREMLRRCYSHSVHKTSPTYSNCSVYKDWHNFSSFFSWCSDKDYYGCDLDKDLLCFGNKIYHPDFCVFVPKSLNLFLSVSCSKKTNHLIGVKVEDGRYVSRIRLNGKQVRIGYFNNEKDAHESWISEKIKIADSYMDLCMKIHPSLYAAIINRIENLRGKRQCSFHSGA